MKKLPINFDLTVPITTHQKGEELNFSSIQIEAPNGNVRNEYFQLKRYWNKAGVQFTKSMNESNPEEIGNAIEEIEEEETEDKPKKKDINAEIDTVTAILLLSDIDTIPMYDALNSILLKQGKWNAEYPVKEGNLKRIDLEDLEKLLVFYLANFM